jgi:hypothetical protein
MSEPMTTTDIEDVLSSIRKLVSEDLRPAQPRGPLRLAPEPGKLILTPALRVTGPDPAPAADRPAAAAEEPADLPQAADPVDAVHAVPFASVRLDGVVASIGAAVDDVAAQPWESETGDAPVTELPWVRPAQAEAPADAARAEPEPAAVVLRDVPEPEPVVLRDVPEPAPVAAARPEPEPEPVAARDVPEPEPVAARAAPDPEPAAQDWAEEPQPQAWAQGEADDIQDLDEDTLREIIRDVIREELQGQMGERITRNIRKLVRAEIHRALTLRDAE